MKEFFEFINRKKPNAVLLWISGTIVFDGIIRSACSGRWLLLPLFIICFAVIPAFAISGAVVNEMTPEISLPGKVVFRRRNRPDTGEPTVYETIFYLEDGTHHTFIVGL